MATSNSPPALTPAPFSRRDGVHLSRLAAHFLRTDDLPSARACAALAAALAPDSYEAQVAFAATSARASDTPRAISAYLRALNLRPTAGAAWTGLAELYLSTFDYEKAAGALRQALLLDRQGQRPWGRRARALAGQALAQLTGRAKT
ncbi:MAG: hypothetical protein IT381_19220 [Deltaproteobacteria bacterium]|nr:hypothetical protein [Deltaproteobacteria bacterium]